MGCVVALGLWVATAMLLVKGAPPRGRRGTASRTARELSPRVQRLVARKRCRRCSTAFLIGLGFGVLIAAVWNIVHHIYLVSSRHPPLFRGRPVVDGSMLDEAEVKVLKAAIRINTIIMAVVLGLLCGVILWLSTAILLLRGGHNVGMHLSLLSVFFPGYSVTLERRLDRLAVGFCLWRTVRGPSSTGVMPARCANVFASRLLDSRVPRASSRRRSSCSPAMRSASPRCVDGVAASAHDKLAGRAGHGAVQHQRRAARANTCPATRFRLREASSVPIELFAVAFVLSHVLAGIYNTVARSRMQQDVMDDDHERPTERPDARRRSWAPARRALRLRPRTRRTRRQRSRSSSAMAMSAACVARSMTPATGSISAAIAGSPRTRT